MRKIRVLLIVSLLVNILLIGYGTYIKKDAIVTKTEEVKYSVFYSEYENKASLSTMNNTNESNEITESINIGSNETLKILIIGNSISYHPIAINIGWNQACGMGASTKEKDYVHVLLKDISAKYPSKNIEMKIVNLSSFEREFKTFEYVTNFHPDLAIFQLGENITLNNDREVFKNNYIKLINSVKSTNKTLTICTSPFFPSLEKTEVIKEVCAETNSSFVDLSHLTLLDKSNYAYTEGNYSNKGVGVHPGDKGMKSISKELFIEINSVLR